MKMKTTRYLVRGALIAALYAAVTIAFAPLSFGTLQVRVAEALTLAPLLFPEAAAGLTVGCLLANLIGGVGVYDVVFGTLATLMAAFLTRQIGKSRLPSRAKYLLAPLPPVLCNGVIVGGMLYYLLLGTPEALPLWLVMLQVAAGELIACYLLGLPLLRLLARFSHKGH